MTETKAELRKEYTRLRAAIPPEQRKNAGQVIADRVINSKEFIESDRVFTFVSIGSEVPTPPIIEKALSIGKPVAVPLVLNRKEMCFITITGLGELKEGTYGIAEPEYSKERLATPTCKSLVLTPGLAFDPSLKRLGYGGGYYDRFFARYPMAIKVGIGFSVQYTKSPLPCTPEDIALDMFISENIIRRK